MTLRPPVTSSARTVASRQTQARAWILSQTIGPAAQVRPGARTDPTAAYKYTEPDKNEQTIPRAEPRDKILKNDIPALALRVYCHGHRDTELWRTVTSIAQCDRRNATWTTRRSESLQRRRSNFKLNVLSRCRSGKVPARLHMDDSNGDLLFLAFQFLTTRLDRRWVDQRRRIPTCARPWPSPRSSSVGNSFRCRMRGMFASIGEGRLLYLRCFGRAFLSLLVTAVKNFRAIAMESPWLNSIKA
jgi:hypothetical protein